MVGLATGLDFADALTGATLIGRDDIGPGPMLLTDTDDLPDSVATYLGGQTATVEGIAIFGGTAAISDGVRDDVAGILGFAQP